MLSLLPSARLRLLFTSFLAVAASAACDESAATAPPTEAGADASMLVDGSASVTPDAAPPTDAGDGGAPDVAAGPVRVGADGGTLSDASVACARTPGRNVAAFANVFGATITADTALTLTIPDGFRIRGVVHAENVPSGGRGLESSVTVLDPATLRTYDTASAADLTSYGITLTPGAYYLQYLGTVEFPSNGKVTSSGYEIVDVCGDQLAHDVEVPPFPALTPVTITVTDPDLVGSLGSPFGGSLALETRDGTFRAEADLTGSPATAKLMIPLGTTLIPTFRSGVTTIARGAPVTLGGDATLGLPPFVAMSGTLSVAGGGVSPGVLCAVGQGASLGAPFPSVGVFTGDVTGAGNAFAYSLSAPDGTACQLQVGAVVRQGVADGGSLAAWISRSPVATTVHPGAKQDFALPDVGQLVSITATIVDAWKAPVRNAHFEARSTTLAAPRLAGYGSEAFSSSAGVDGSSRVAVVAGTYDIVAE